MDQEQTRRVASWLEQLSAELRLPLPTQLDVVLDVAKDAAHRVERPAAPITTFMLGYAVARGVPIEDAAAVVARLARDFDV